jgi:predicted adenylyl cyclase CyaB
MHSPRANIEIKARAVDRDALRRCIERLASKPVAELHQEDTFFGVPHGRLKLRVFDSTHAELIRYDRPDLSGPKTSRYTIAPTSDPASMMAILTSLFTPIGVVRKQRTLYMVGQTRIHLDSVEGLGDFLELEVVMREDQPAAEGEAIARELMHALEIREEDLVEGAYLDLLLRST